VITTAVEAVLTISKESLPDRFGAGPTFVALILNLVEMSDIKNMTDSDSSGF
jgi:hypothetical protein